MTLSELLMLERRRGPRRDQPALEQHLPPGRLLLSCAHSGCPVIGLTLTLDETPHLDESSSPVQWSRSIPDVLPCPVCGEPLAPHGFERSPGPSSATGS